MGITLTPLIGWLVIAAQSFESATKWHGLCLGMVKNNPLARKQCMDDYVAHKGPDALPLMWEMFVAALQAGAILWLICFAATKTIRWILAGRKHNHKL